MASKKQIAANRRNAKSSTGPRTLAGKDTSRRNALRDGLTGQITTLPEKDRILFDSLKAEMIAGFDPKTVMERKLAHAIAWDTWRLDHLRAIEMNVYALGNAEADSEADAEANAADEAEDPLNSPEPDELDIALSDARTFRSEAKRFELMSLYEQRMNRNMHRNLATLRDLQAERKRNYERDKKDEITLARLHEFNEMPIQVSAAPSKNGFLFSNEEIAIGAVRQRYLDTATCLLKDTNPRQLYGGLRVGCGDTFLETLSDKRPLSAEERTKIRSVPPESIALRRLSHPEEFGLSKV